MKLIKGGTVYYNNEAYEIVSAISFEEVLAKPVGSTEVCVLKIGHLKPEKQTINKITDGRDLEAYTEAELAEAKRRYEIIKPLSGKYSRKATEKRAEEKQISTATLYEWLSRYNQDNLLSSLIPKKGRGAKGKSRLDAEQESIMVAVIEEFYKSRKKPKVSQAWDEVRNRCDKSNVDVPSLATFRRRIAQKNEKDLIFSREGKKKAKLYEPYPYKYDDAVRPMHIVEIDHTRLDIYLVDDNHRMGLGRPWITIAIDEYSRMVVGFYLSFEAPGFLATGQTIAMMMLKKNSFLLEHDIQSDWPVWGKAEIIYTDSAKEFRGNGLKKACEEYGMLLQHRPIGKTEFGGIVERIMREVNQRVHLLDGTTFSNIFERGEYDSEGCAVMTLKECETAIAVAILEDYHNQVHGSLDEKTPLEKYHEGIFGTDTIPPAGLPETIDDERRLKINMLPFDMRSVQRYGIRIENVTYYHQVLNRWIHSYELDENPKIRRKFIVRRDPHNIGKIFFYDPDVNEYFEIPAVEIRVTDNVSLWEWRAVGKKQRNKEKRKYTATETLHAIRRIRKIEEESAHKTKKARKNVNRRSNLKLVVNDESKLPPNDVKSAVHEETRIDPYANVDAFGGIDDGEISDFVPTNNTTDEKKQDDDEWIF